MRKVCHVHVLPVMSGPQNWTVRFFETLPLDAYELHVVLGGEGEFGERLQQMGVKVHILPSLVRAISPFRDLRSLTALTRLLRREGMDLVHTHSSKPGVIGRLAARLARVPAVIHHVHGFAFNNIGSFWERGLYRTVERVASRLCDHVIFVNDEERVSSIDGGIVPSDRASTIYNGADLELYNPRKRQLRRAGAREALGVKPAQSVIAFVGRIVAEKEPLQLVATLDELRRSYPNLDPLILAVGDGELRGELEERARAEGLGDRLRILGWRDDVHEVLYAADIVYLPSRYEGLPLALIEAACMGLPAVATDVKGSREVILDGETGALYPLGDRTAAAEALGSILSSRELAERLGARAAQSALSRYDVRKNSNAVAELYAEHLRS